MGRIGERGRIWGRGRMGGKGRIGGGGIGGVDVVEVAVDTRLVQSIGAARRKKKLTWPWRRLQRFLRREVKERRRDRTRTSGRD